MALHGVRLPLQNGQHQRNGPLEPLQSREQRRESALFPRPLQARLEGYSRAGRLGGRLGGQRCFELREQENSIGEHGDEFINLNESSTPHWDRGKILGKGL